MMGNLRVEELIGALLRGFIVDPALTLLPGIIVSILVGILFKKFQRDNTLRNMFLYFILHGERLIYVLDLFKNNKQSHGSIEIANVGNLMTTYLALKDSKMDRRRIIMSLYDALHQICFHFNMPVSERNYIIRFPDNTKRSSYAIAIDFIADKIPEYLENLYRLEKNLPCFKLRDYLPRFNKKKRKTYALRLLEEKLPR